MIRRIIQGLLVFAIGIFLLVLLAISGTFLYVYFNRDVLISRVSETINRSISGELVTGPISVDFLHFFPNASVHIASVSIRDSLFRQHKMEFLHSDDVFVKINFWELFSSQPALENISFENGSIYIFKDRSGYSNNYLLRTNVANKNRGFNAVLREINFKNFRFVFNDQQRNRYHNIFLKDFICGIHTSEEKTTLAVRSQGKIKMLAFNLKKGAYARNATFSNNLIVYYHKKDSTLEIPEHTFYMNDHLIIAKAQFHMGEPSNFSAELNASRILFSDASKVLMMRTEKLLSNYKIKRPLRIRVQISGSMQPGAMPLVNADLYTAANTVTYKEYVFSNCKLETHYTNRYDSLRAISPSNNEVVITNFSGSWNGIPVSSDLIRFYNFPFPSVSAKLSGVFPLKDLNRLPGGGVYDFSSGSCGYQLAINATSDSLKWNTDIQLACKIKDGLLLYEPRGIAFQDVNANIMIHNDDVFIEHASCRSGTSFLSLKGKAPGILNTDIRELRKLQLNWEIKSSYVNLDDFTAFLGRRKKGLPRKAVRAESEKTDFGKHLERYLDACGLHMKLDIDALRFDRFTATGLSGIVQLTDDNWSLHGIRFNHADGEVKLSGTLSPEGDNQQSVNIQTSLKHVNISDVFTAFDNFSQRTITASQINGVLDADVQLGFIINNKAAISQSSISGMVDLSIRNGELKGFQPMGKLSKFLFRNRDFSDIKFSELTNSFAARGNEIYFDRMKINSSVMEIYLEGSYFLDGKTDMDIQIPLSNLKARDWEEISGNVTDKGDKGMNVFIHAATDENGDLKFKYVPLKKLKDKRSRNKNF